MSRHKSIRDRIPIDDPVKVCYTVQPHMPLRTTPLATGEVYHIFNRGHTSAPIFYKAVDYKKFIETMLYYQNSYPPLRFSKFTQLRREERNKILDQLRKKGEFLVDLVSYCLMPTHFHFELKQNIDNGILRFIYLLSNSYSHYFNTKYRRKGTLFEGRFKAVHVITDSQLLHLSRYIHLNPYSSYVVKDLNQLFKYPYSSLPEYLGLIAESYCQKDLILSQFQGIESYREFINDGADYQRSLEEIKHITLE